jgi:hypothetical protein
MLSYHGEGESSDNEVMSDQNSERNNEVDSLDFFHFNETQPELAHLQLGRVETFFLPVD